MINKPLEEMLLNVIIQHYKQYGADTVHKIFAKVKSIELTADLLHTSKQIGCDPLEYCKMASLIVRVGNCWILYKEGTWEVCKSEEKQILHYYKETKCIYSFNKWQYGIK